MRTIHRPGLAVLGLLAALAAALAVSAGWAARSAQALTCFDRTAPSLSVGVSPNLLAPADFSMRDVTASVRVKDDCDPSPTVWLASITASGPDIPNGPSAGPDVQGATFGPPPAPPPTYPPPPPATPPPPDLAFQLRAERDGDGTSRIYAITYQTRDSAGRTTTKHTTVTVAAFSGSG